MKLLLLPLLVLSSLASGQERDYQWTKVTTAELNAGIKVTGRMIPQDGALNIESARIAGRVLSILRREGDRVTVGTPLFAISSAECISLLEEKKVASSNGIQQLIGSVSKREKQLAISVDEASCKVVSAHSGILTKRSVESGAAFNPGDPLVTILDVNRLTAEFDLPERDMAKVKLTQPVHFRLASDPDSAYLSKISHIVPMIDSTSRTTKVRVDPVKIKSATTQDALIFGEIETGSKESILKVPSAALVFSHNRQYVIRGPKAKAAVVEVSVLGEADNFSSIRPIKPEDLKDGDLVAGSGGIFLLKQLNTDMKL
jgi:multidrug efflux pump subunit AcrA (membrane-fusion protein)